MSNPRPYLPPDLLDCVVDPLFDERETLRQCCLVSKSWVPHTRKYLFADIRFQSPGDLKAWKKTFPDPANSPAHHTRTLLVGCLQIVTAADVEEGGWIRTFHNVVRLEVWSVGSLGRLEGPLVPFHNFSPALKSLRMVSNNLRCSQVFDLICSLPLLEDLSIMSHGMDRCDYGGTAFQPSTSPVLNGVLVLFLPQGVECATRRLFGLPNGLHFRKLMCTWWLEEDLQRIVDLLAVCSDTLECVDIECFLSRTFTRLLRWGHYLTGTPVCARDCVGGFDQIVQSNKTQASGIPVQCTAHHVDHHGAPNDHIRT